IAVSVTAGILLITMSIPPTLPAAYTFEIGRMIGIAYCCLAILVAMLSILLKPRDSLQPESFKTKVTFKLSNHLGRGEIAFSFVFLISILSSYKSRPNYLLLLLIFWLITLLFKPHEVLHYIVNFWKDLHTGVTKEGIGIVRAFENPGIAIVSLTKGEVVKPGTSLCILDSNTQIRIGRSVAEYELQDERWMRVLLSQKSVENRTTEGEKLFRKSQLNPNTAFILDSTKLDKVQIDSDTKSLLISNENPLIGFVAEESMINYIQIELFSPNSDVYEGRLVTTTIKGDQVFYQIIDAVTKSEVLEKKSSLGYFRVRARKMGKWDESQKRFKAVKWLPKIYSPVYLWKDEPVGFQIEAVGHIPGTSFSVSLDLNDAVTHNTAILGVLGCGKTFLALELIARLVTKGIKVICLDITGQYSSQLSQYYNPEKDEQDDNSIKESIEEYAEHVSRDKEEGGNRQRFRDLIKENINQFLEDEERDIRIYNPEEYLVWKQTGGLFQRGEGIGEAARATLTPVEITRIVSEGVLEAVNESLTNKARVCIVFEEAHSLIPEWRSISFKADEQAAMGTVKAILQGRKYGLGCIIVTQRTANVMKSVLNQCNTIFAMRTFDATGMEFLSNYIGKDYTNALSILEERNAVVYGRAISSDSPLIIRVNERSDFLTACQQIPEQEVPNNDEEF
ncbi:MAG: ATP-binding protein, partial [Petrotogales bacterium]